MLTNCSCTRRCSAHLRSLLNHWRLVLFAILVLLLIARQDSAAQTVEAPGVVVTGEAIATPTPHDNFREMRQHILPEVQGAAITVTKKATVIKLDQQPPIENNNEQDLFIKAPGFLITEQHTPGQFNFSYRGLGNPQESEFTLVLRDGLPLMSDSAATPSASLPFLPLVLQALAPTIGFRSGVLEWVMISAIATKLISARLRAGGRRAFSILLEPRARSRSARKYRIRSILWTSN